LSTGTDKSVKFHGTKKQLSEAILKDERFRGLREELAKEILAQQFIK